MIRSLTLPRRGPSGEAIGGFSAAAYRGADDTLWVLSDAPHAVLLRWQGVRRLVHDRAATPELASVLPLTGSARAPLPAAIDGEGLVLRGEDEAWVASEGRVEPGRPALLLRFDRRTGVLEQSIPLPPEWQPRPTAGLEPNGGPESLTLWPAPPAAAGAPPQLLMAAEHPLRQDAPRSSLRTLLWTLEARGARLSPQTLPPLPIPPGAPPLGLTDLLSLPAPAGTSGQLLTLWRGFEPPARWRTVLGLLERSGAGWRERGRWDLLAAGLPPDNWEAITPGPDLADGRPSYLLLSDDNFNPLQENRLALIAPRLPEACASPNLKGGEGQGRRGTAPPG
ncbi:MAG: esterase-like activity of phytase family protein [Synechococcus sp.]|nr:esterase-like activity of phytase family protein [Synechococcus sp.]